jgi:hypothetical protein
MSIGSHLRDRHLLFKVGAPSDGPGRELPETVRDADKEEPHRGVDLPVATATWLLSYGVGHAGTFRSTAGTSREQGGPPRSSESRPPRRRARVKTDPNIRRRSADRDGYDAVEARIIERVIGAICIQR